MKKYHILLVLSIIIVATYVNADTFKYIEEGSTPKELRVDSQESIVPFTEYTLEKDCDQYIDGLSNVETNESKIIRMKMLSLDCEDVMLYQIIDYLITKDNAVLVYDDQATADLKSKAQSFASLAGISAYADNVAPESQSTIYIGNSDKSSSAVKGITLITGQKTFYVSENEKVDILIGAADSATTIAALDELITIYNNDFVNTDCLELTDCTSSDENAFIDAENSAICEENCDGSPGLGYDENWDTFAQDTNGGCTDECEPTSGTEIIEIYDWNDKFSDDDVLLEVKYEITDEQGEWSSYCYSQNENIWYTVWFSNELGVDNQQITLPTECVTQGYPIKIANIIKGVNTAKPTKYYESKLWYFDSDLVQLPTTYSINAKLQLAPIGRDQSNPLNVSIYYQNGNIVSKNVNSDFSGSFTVSDLPAGTINLVRVKPMYYLSKKLDFANIDIATLGELNFGLFKGGDCNNDNKVDSRDISCLSGCYGKTVAQYPACIKADWNRDGVVNSQDIAPLSGSYGTVGSAMVFVSANRKFVFGVLVAGLVIAGALAANLLLKKKRH